MENSNSLKRLLILLLFSFFSNSLYSSNKIEYIEIYIFDGFFLIPNTYSLNTHSLYKTKDRVAPIFTQDSKIRSDGKGVIYIGDLIECEICTNPSKITNNYKVTKHFDLQIINAQIEAPGLSFSTTVIFNDKQYIRFSGGDLSFIDFSLNYYHEGSKQ
jgi:hypothetical protein